MIYNDWNKRAVHLTEYKGEKFYTITPLPYYYARRQIVINNLIREIKEHTTHPLSICDFGCGDGVYIQLLAKKIRNCFFHGVDLSPMMIDLARENTNNISATFEVSATGIQSDCLFDVIYSSAIFAHVEDLEVEKLFNNIANHCKKDGVFILCEQIAPFRYGGETFTRRTCEEYIKMAEKSGFKVHRNFVIDFPAHRKIFERKIQKYFVAHCLKKETISKSEALVMLNHNLIYRGLSHLCTILSHPRIFYKLDHFGYFFAVFQKK